MAPKSKKKWAALKNTVRVPSMLAREQKKRQLKAAEEAAKGIKSPGTQADHNADHNAISAAFPVGHDKPGPRNHTPSPCFLLTDICMSVNLHSVPRLIPHCSVLSDSHRDPA